MIKKVSRYSFLIAFAVITALVLSGNLVQAKRGEGPIIYVTSQGLFYDSIVTTMLPPKGPFQLLEMVDVIPGEVGLQTEFGPGDQGYVGGRWWVDVNRDGEMDGGDMYFGCPLLGPGRENP